MISPSDFLIELQIAAARGAVKRGLDLEKAVEHGTAVAQAFACALKDGTLQDLGSVEIVPADSPQDRAGQELGSLRITSTKPEQLRLEAA